MTAWPADYTCAPGLAVAVGDRAVRPIHWDDRERIRQWRNEQMDVLRQSAELTVEQQDEYFATVVGPQLRESEPAQILLAFEEAGDLVGYGGIVHISWPDRRGELSFLSATERATAANWRDEWHAYVPLMVQVARDHIGLHRLTAETFDFRTDVLSVMTDLGFEREGVLREHHVIDGRYCDSILTGMLLD